MKVYKENDKYTIYNGDSMEMLSVIAPSSVDCIITDPPYELGFMNNKWDKQGIAFNVEFWKKCLQVLKPGGYLLAFGGSKTFHRMAVAIEDSGFEIRDMLLWLYSTGFPKGQDIGLAVDRLRGIPSKVVGRKKGASGTIKGSPDKVEFIRNNQYEDETHDILVAQNEWKGYNTSLKPAYEPIIMARKPVEGTVAQNVVKYGVGGVNIDETRIGHETIHTEAQHDERENLPTSHHFYGREKVVSGRYPSNVILDGSPQVNSIFPMVDRHSASRCFYSAKADNQDRDEGLEDLSMVKIDDGSIRSNSETGRVYGANKVARHNIHPTVKPTSLMQYLVKMVAPPNKGIILDPFCGSGSTGKAVMKENKERDTDYKFIGIEKEEKYLEIIVKRIDYVLNDKTITKQQKGEQLNLFDYD